MLTQHEIESAAKSLYATAGHDGADPIEPERLAHALLGPRSLRFVDESVLIHHDSALARVGAQWRIYLRKGLTPRLRRFSVAHEIAEWFLVTAGVEDDESEQDADAIAAALLAPLPFASAACEHRGRKWGQLALDFGSTESCAALRYGEVTGRPLLLLTPRCVRERGDPCVWPADDVLRSAKRVPRIARARLRDDSSRLVVVRVA